MRGNNGRMCREIDVLDIALLGTNMNSACRSLNAGALQGRRAHGTLGGVAGDGCELLVARVT
jgi:hypothetical protein